MTKKTEEKLIGITAKKDKNFSDWYTEVVTKSGLADYSAVQGCMVFMPYSYEMWEFIQDYINREIKKTGHKNAYFPMFIPEKFLHKEAKHFAGFVPEVAWIERQSEEEERYAIRPTSETIIYDSYSKWVHSYRDLPILLNQWCSVVRWETKATKPFIRTREFLWQEGHTAHATKEEADKEALYALDIYSDLIEKYLAIPVLSGKKSDSEKFAGALYTLTMEALMPDKRALQMGTSHNLGQNFALAFGIKFLDENNKEAHAWNTSWGVSTRLIGAMVMTHGDDKGLIIPPRVAPIKAVIVPIVFDKDKEKILKKARELQKKLFGKFYTVLDDRDNYSPGWKFNEWELKGVPLRIEIGPKDLGKKQVVLVRRDTGEKKAVKWDKIVPAIEKTLADIQGTLYARAKVFLESNIHEVKNFKEFQETLEKKRGFIKANWCGDPKCEQEVKEKTTATIRLIPFVNEKATGSCVHCRNKGKYLVYWAKNY